MSKLNVKTKLSKSRIIYIYLVFYFFANLAFLTKFPFMHSDESWLSGLSRSIAQNGFASTEYFFDVLPRYPHAIKSIFHAIQIVFIQIFGYNLFAVRLVSLLFGILAIILFYKIVQRLCKSEKIAIIISIVFSLDIQFIYASHFARQEIIIVAAMLFAIYYMVKNTDKWSYKNDVILAVFIGLSVGIHPNSFLVALIVGALYLYYIFVEKKLSIKNLGLLVGVVSGFAILFILLSLSFDKDFLTHYLYYGENLGVVSSNISRLDGFVGYINRLYSGINVTYYLPNIKAQFILFFAAIISGVILVFIKKYRKLLLVIFTIIALLAGIIIIGRYSQPGIILLFPLCYLLLALIASKLGKAGVVSLVLIGVIIASLSSAEIISNTSGDYDKYLDNISTYVPADAKVLANLNTEYAFDYNSILDYRNLEYLTEGYGFTDYIKDNQIEYIIYPQEMDFIYSNRPVWNVMYGNLYPYYDEMQSFIFNDCTYIGEFVSPYAMRIVDYADDVDWYVKIYKVK